jgi:hypothetical protein
MRFACLLLLVASSAKAEWGSPEARKLVAGDLGVVRLIKNDKKLVLEVYFPRAWRSHDVKAGTKIAVSEVLVLADEGGVFFSGPAPIFLGVAECENDGGVWVEPVARLELDPAQLKRPLLGKPIGSERTIGLATLGQAPRKALASKPGKRSLLRVDFDGDGAADAELRSAPTESGCGQGLSEQDLQVADAVRSSRARCCGP